MPIVTLDGGQSSVALGGQVVQYVSSLVLQQIAGAPDTLVQSQLQLVLREFYTKSTGWRDNFGPYQINSGVSSINLNPIDQNTRLQFVLGAFLFPFQGSNSPLWLRNMPRAPIGGVPQLPSRFFMQRPDVLVLDPVPDQTYGQILNVYACAVPVTTGVQLPDIAYTHHVDGLLWGTLARLYQMPKKPWTNQDLAKQYMKQYRMEILMARDIANRGYGPADTAIRYPAFAGRNGSQVLPRATG